MFYKTVTNEQVCDEVFSLIYQNKKKIKKTNRINGNY